MNEPNLGLLIQLSQSAAVSGDESRVRSLILEAVEPVVDEVRTDSIGNLLCTRRGSGKADLRVMLAAHMDEVGLMVTDVDKDGSLRFACVGGIDPRVLPSKAVKVGADGVPGVIGVKAVHLTERSERKRAIKTDALRIDIGAESKEDAKTMVKRGDYAVFDTVTDDLGPTLKGKAFDDRAGCALLVQLLETRYPFDVVAAFTVQEEVGMRGARVAAHALEPDLALVLECGTTDDGPKDRPDTPVMRLGHGPAITVMDRTVVADQRLVGHLRGVADRQGLKYQIRAPKGGGTDAGAIHLARAGVPSAVVSVPCRYLHSPVSVISKSDLSDMLALMRVALMELTPAVLRAR